MSDIKNTILDILEEVCDTEEVKDNLDIQLFNEGLLDSFGTVSLLVELESRLGIGVNISE